MKTGIGVARKFLRTMLGVEARLTELEKITEQQSALIRKYEALTEEMMSQIERWHVNARDQERLKMEQQREAKQQAALHEEVKELLNLVEVLVAE